MKILVTGGAGFIGSNIVLRLLEQGIEPVVLDNLTSGYRQNLPEGVQFIEEDVRNAATVARAAEGCSVIIHLAASVGNKRSIDNPIEDSQINVLGTLNILETARRMDIHRVVFSSSAGTFGELKTLPISEDHPQEPDSPYGASKLAAEKLCLVYNKLYQMHNVCLRYFNVYGPHQRYDAYGNVIPIFATRVLNRQPLVIFGDGEQTRDFVHVYDVADANIKSALANGVKGAFNIGSATRVTINYLAGQIQEAAGINVGVMYAPPRPGDVRDSLADIRLAQNSFGFAPQTSLPAGLQAYWNWLSKDEITLHTMERSK